MARSVIELQGTWWKQRDVEFVERSKDRQEEVRGQEEDRGLEGEQVDAAIDARVPALRD
jgi:hypothetical protein